MQAHNDNFTSTLHKFVKELNKINTNKDIQNVLHVYNKLNMKRVMKRFLSVMKPYKTHIAEETETMFSNNILILPKINIKFYWENANETQQKRFWVYLKMLYILSELCLDESNSIMGDELTKQLPENKPEFNPYVGVGPTDETNNSSSYGVNNMFSGVEEQGNIETGIGPMAEMLGVDLDKLTDELKNMGDGDVDEATNNIMGMLGTGVDPKTSSAISEMLVNISSELKTTDISKNNLFENIAGIAKSVASKMKPKVESGELNISDLLTSTQNIASQYVGETGDNNFNPVEMINSMMNSSNMATVNENNTENNNEGNNEGKNETSST